MTEPVQSKHNKSAVSFEELKFGDHLDIEVQSPDSSIWQSLFADQMDLGADCMMICSPRREDFMIISSPKRDDLVLASPKREDSLVSSSSKLVPPLEQPDCYDQGLHGRIPHSWSHPSCSSAPMATFNSSYNKGKPPSPLHKVYSCPQFVQPDNVSLSSWESSLLDDYEKDEHPTTEVVPILGRSADSFHNKLPPRTPTMQDYLFESSFGEQGVSVLGSNLAFNPERDVCHGLVGPATENQEKDSGLKLVHLLLACAEAVAMNDFMSARRRLNLLRRAVTPLGDSMQRVASCFAEALSARLTAISTTKATPITSTFLPSSPETLKIYQILYQACPYIKFAHFTANQAILEAFESENRVHVIDLDILQGYQWPAFMQALAARSGGAPFLRMTGVGSPLESVKETGRRLTELAFSLHVPFEFHPVAERLEDLQPHMLHRKVGEALAVNSVGRLHRVAGNSLGSLIAMIRDQAPNIVTLVEQDASHNGPHFLGRFLEALHYYSAIFDSLDETFPVDSPERAKLEQCIFGPKIGNIVACEGAERTERHEKLEKWRKIMEGKRFKGVPLSANAVTQSKILLGLYPCDGYRLTEDKGCLLLGWQDRAILSASAWRC